MAVTSHAYPLAIEAINNGTIDLTSATAGAFKMLLMTGSAATWTATQWAYQFASSPVTAYTEVAAGGGYSTGGVALTSMTQTIEATANILKLTCASPVSFGASTTITAASALIYCTLIGSAYASYPAIAIIDFGGSVSSTAGAWTYTIDATNGLIYWTMS